MIDHSKCDHERSSKARAICRRKQAGDDKPTRKKMGATPKEIGAEEDRYGQTPRDAWMECDNCGVEKIAYRGPNRVTRILRSVGERCKYTLDPEEITPLD